MDNKPLLMFLTIVQLSTTGLYLAWKFQKSKRWRNRRWWVRPINSRREEQGDFGHLFQELKDDPDLFFRYTRMKEQTFYELLTLVSPYLEKHSRRQSITSEARLAITLRYLATGDQMMSVAQAFRIGESTAHLIVNETCAVLANVLAPIYLPVPNQQRWLEISEGFLNKWNMPNCVGAIDGKHVLIQAPPNSGSIYYNYKKTFSIVLLAACDSNYKFTLFDVGAYGGQNDGSILAESSFGQALRTSTLDLPGEARLPGSNIIAPFYFVGDQAFQMSQHLMRPYPGRQLNNQRKIFNYRLSRARRTIENAYGILASRWRVYRKPICANPETVVKIILATMSLHNFLMTKSDETILEKIYCPLQVIDRETEDGMTILGEWRLLDNNLRPIGRTGAHHANVAAYRIRDSLSTYFLTPAGELQWQYGYVRRE